MSIVETPRRTVTIRRARQDDVVALAQLALHFVRETHYPVLEQHVSEDRIGGLLMTLLAMPEHAGLVLVAVDEQDVPFGGIAVFAGPHPIAGFTYADELCWWVEPGKRGLLAGPRLLQNAERWAKSYGLHGLKMIAPYGSTVGEFYARRGYVAIETAYYKEF